MSLSSAKAKLDAQGGDPVTGYISKTDHKESYDELLDDTALTGATTAEAITVSGAAVAGTLNGRDPDDLVAGPASATDNALVRFDGTDGMTVQNSGITVDDSGNITSDVTMSKASPILSVSASTTTTASIYFDNAAAGSYGRCLFRVNGSKRWEFGRDGTAEAGANAGSDFYISNYSDASAAIGIPFKIARSTGKTTLGYVGATAGLELGSSGPRIMSGTGSPEGVVTAPVGSQWIDTAATTGAIKWIKATGTGNTGWVVEYGDTGRRVLATGDITAATNVTATTSGFWLHRIGNTVTATLALTAGATIPSDTAWCNVAAGFRPTATLWGTSGYGLAAAWTLAAAGNFVVYTSVAAGAFRVSLSYLTTDAWPASLPGSAA